MNMLQNFIIFFMIGCVGCVTQPPIMLSYPKTRVPFKDGETVSLLCVATGDPQPTYRWIKDGDKFDSSGFDDRWVMIPNSGNLVCNKPEKKDVGLYQCFASNAHGVAMSLMYDLRQAFLDDFAKENSKTIQVSLGHPVKLNCIEPSSFPDAVMFWVLKYRDGGFEAIDYDDRVTMDLEGRLIITNVKEQDYQNGRAYACMAMNTFVRTNTQGKEYYIIPTGSQAAEMEPRRMWTSPSELSFELGQTARMKCIWVGNPTPEVFWTRNNQQLSDSKYQLYSFGQELRINDLQFEDAGNYECSGRNKLTQTSPNYKIFVSVYSKPRWIHKPQNVESSVGGSATFICDAESQPNPDVRQWFIDGVLTSKKNLDVNKYFISSTNLTIVDLIKEDAMTIQCNISNKYGYVFTNAYLNVLEEKPEFVKAPEAQMKASEGQNTNLSCQTAGQPKPQVLWYKDGKQITGGRYRTLSNGDLYIQNLVVADAGDYSCIAKNRYGEVSGSGRLIIRRQTRIEQVPLDLEANAGTDAKFTCAGTTDPMEVSKLTITWLKDDKPITTGEQRMAQNFQDNSLTISGITIRDAGRYTCVASNGLDEARASAMLTVRAKPESPSSVKVRCETYQATITWTPGSDNNAPIQYFIIQYNTTFEKDQWYFGAEVDLNTNQKTIIMSPYANYTFRVLAINKIGESEPSAHTTDVCQTPSTTPFQQPGNVHTRGDEKGKLLIEWTPMRPLMHNGRDFRYIITVKKENSTDVETVYTIQDWKQRRKVIQTNNVYMPYRISMKAKNSHGDAKVDPVSIVGYSGEDVPNVQITDVQVSANSSTTAVVTFSGVDPKSTLIRGHFRGYKVQFWKRGYKEETFQDYSFYLDTTPFYGRSRRSTGPPISLNLQHLYPNSRIEIQVLVMNTYYVSRPSDVVSFETFEGVPGPVPFLIASVRGSNHFLLKWDKPTDSNGVITGYDIAFQTVIGLNLGKMRDREPQIHEPELTQIRLSGLKSFQLYRVYIWARTRIGRGEPYYIDVATTKPGVPNAPTFSFVHIDYTYVNITWPIHKNMDLHGSVYYVEFRKEGASDWQQSTDESVLSWKKIANLETGTSYEFRLVATNGQETRPSAIQVATTHGYFVGFAGTSAWLYGMLVALLIIICAAIILFVTRKKIAERRQKSYQKSMQASKTNVGNAPEFEDERGFNNDYHDGFNDSFKKSQSTITPEADNLPPSYNDVKGYDDHHYKNDPQYDDQYYDQEGYDDRYYEHGEYDQNYEYPEYDDQYDGHYEDYDYRYNSKNDVHYEEPVPSKKKEYLDWGEASGTNDTCV